LFRKITSQRDDFIGLARGLSITHEITDKFCCDSSIENLVTIIIPITMDKDITLTKLCEVMVNAWVVIQDIVRDAFIGSNLKPYCKLMKRIEATCEKELLSKKDNQCNYRQLGSTSSTAEEDNDVVECTPPPPEYRMWAGDDIPGEHPVEAGDGNDATMTTGDDILGVYPMEAGDGNVCWCQQRQWWKISLGNNTINQRRKLSLVDCHIHATR
jgi:hypothetical protein